MPARPLIVLACCLVPVALSPAAGPPGEAVAKGVWLFRDDAGQWGGSSKGITHQSGADYWARKRIDLSGLDEKAWANVREARLSAYFCVRDYSRHATGKVNGFDEAFEIVVNGRPHRYPTNTPGLPRYRDGVSMAKTLGWFDFVLPKAELVRGVNEFLFRKAVPPGKKADDYLYLGIDVASPGGHSWVRFGEGQPWRQDKLTVPGTPGAGGEYMVRLYLFGERKPIRATWRPEDDRREDPDGLIAYAGSHAGRPRMEWHPRRLDPAEPVAVEVAALPGAKPLVLRWLDAEGKPAGKPVVLLHKRATVRYDGSAGRLPGGVELNRSAGLAELMLQAAKGYHPVSEPIDIAPRMRPCAGRVRKEPPACTMAGRRVELAGAGLSCVFDTSGKRLRLASLRNYLADAEVVREGADASALFVVETGGRRLRGSRDFALTSVTPLAGKRGFRAMLTASPADLEAEFRAWVQDGELQLDLKVTPRGEKTTSFKVAFPHLAGLAISDSPGDDYYYYPWGGGIIADRPAHIRGGYGDHVALYQMMDLFSPSRGAGLSLRCLDTDGRYKVLALRNHIPGRSEVHALDRGTPTAKEYCWDPPSLDGKIAPGTALSIEYLRRTRKPGESFEACPVELGAHAGDWRVPMQHYADWCHRTWRFRKRPSKLTPVVHMIAAGWGKSPIFRNGQYRTDYLRPDTDCIELMSWWEWSALGPGGFPIDQLAAKLGAAKAERWQSYLVKDPVTGKVMFSNNPGDYDGYNARWGGLPAFRKAVAEYQRRGHLVTLYTDPFRVDRASTCGRTMGEKFGVVKPDATYRDDYDAYRMCHDAPEYRAWVARAMARVMRETGADGIRLDEYGHRGSACFSRKHKHTYAEPGCTEWQRGVAEATRLVREAMDRAAPGSVLTTEHPGYDFLLPHIEGCITYDLTVVSSPLRPLECNTQRFYFGECKAYELDHRQADPRHYKRFWNAVGSFGSYYPEAMYRVLRENADAFELGHAVPLLPTKARYVYANRFSTTAPAGAAVAPGAPARPTRSAKVLYTLYNATGHTFAGPALTMDVRDGEHVFDLLRGRPADVRRGKRGTVVHVYLPRDESTCLVRLRRRLDVKRQGDVLQVRATGAGKDWQVVLCNTAGAPLLKKPTSAPAGFSLTDKACQGATQVKLMAGERLVDVAAVP